jgi:hypothetical protein
MLDSLDVFSVALGAAIIPSAWFTLKILKGIKNRIRLDQTNRGLKVPFAVETCSCQLGNERWMVLACLFFAVTRARKSQACSLRFPQKSTKMPAWAVGCHNRWLKRSRLRSGRSIPRPW